MTVTALSVINIFTDEFDQVKAEGKYLFYVHLLVDVNLLFNYLWAMPSMK